MIRFLTQNQATDRANSVKTGVTYKLFLNLDKGKHFNGLMHVEFELIDTKNVFLDFGGKAIECIEVNGHQYENDKVKELWKDGYINLPVTALKEGKNIAIIKFNNDYNTDGNGLHSYTDVDGKQYIYCQSEPYWINRVYPVFDQPDIKGYMNFFILSPHDWEIISNENYKTKTTSNNFVDENKNSDDQFIKLLFKHLPSNFDNNDKNMYIFDQTLLLSSYLHAFVGGPYRKIELEDHENTVPMAIYCRDGLYNYVQEQKTGIFKFGIEGIKFYTNFFKVPYPFKKYDYVFCPEFTVGAMEYPGVVTYNDRYIFREIPNKVQVSNRGRTINHELAHMWFGDLVTMKWWNDLWLNESFADFSCFLCNAMIADKLPFETTESWNNFVLRKNWGYDEDQLITTHPIACTVSATNHADSIFDGITYSKGASVLKQLYFLIGHENFSKNISNYFNKYKWKNTTLDNFMEELNNFENKTGHEAYDLMKWQDDWIKKAGLNAVEVEWDPSVQGKTCIKLKQTAVTKEHPTLRYHKIEIALIDSDGKTADTKTVLLDNKPETNLEIDNKGYKAILPNHNDWSFLKIILDPHSLQFITENLMKIDNPLSQLLIIRSFYEMVKDAKMKGTSFVSTILNGYLESTLTNIQTFDAIMLFLEKVVFSYMPKDLKFSNAHIVFNRLLTLINDVQEFDKKKLIKKKMLTFGIGEDDIDILRKHLDEALINDDNTLNVQDKWRIVFKINGSSHFDDNTKAEYVKKLESIDNSDTRKSFLIRIENLKADKDKRQQLWAKYIDPSLQMSYGDLQDNFIGFFSMYVNDDLKLPYSLDMFKKLDEICRTRSNEMGDCFLDYCLPENHHAKIIIDQLENVLPKLTSKEDYFKIKIRKIIDIKKKQLNAFGLYEN